jgi:ABC-type glutathione transport system ATPase component
MGFAISLASCFLGGSGERRGTRVESYQTDQLKTSAARLWTLDSRLLPPQPSTPLALPQPSTLDPRLSTLDSSCSAKALDSGPSPLDSSSGLRAGEFFAVKDVSFELRRGECLGLIGHNGAGKTTLLKMLNGLIKPDAGSITMRGRVGALIGLGAGFYSLLIT